jgi:hypothetical protein
MINHLLMNRSPNGLMTSIPTQSDIKGDSATSLVIQPLPRQWTSELMFDRLLSSVKPIENLFVIFVMTGSAIDVKFNRCVILADHIVES